MQDRGHIQIGLPNRLVCVDEYAEVHVGQDREEPCIQVWNEHTMLAVIPVPSVTFAVAGIIAINKARDEGRTFFDLEKFDVDKE